VLLVQAGIGSVTLHGRNVTNHITFGGFAALQDPSSKTPPKITKASIQRAVDCDQLNS
jgi:hypothetical protein